MTLHKQKDYIMATFDFEEAAKWFKKVNNKDISIQTLKAEAGRCIDECIQEKSLYYSKIIKGVEAEYSDGYGKKDKIIELRYIPIYISTNAMNKIFDR